MNYRRRTFLTTVAASTLAISGCAESPSGSNDSGGNVECEAPENRSPVGLLPTNENYDYVREPSVLPPAGRNFEGTEEEAFGLYTPQEEGDTREMYAKIVFFDSEDALETTKDVVEDILNNAGLGDVQGPIAYLFVEDYLFIGRAFERDAVVELLAEVDPLSAECIRSQASWIEE